MKVVLRGLEVRYPDGTCLGPWTMDFGLGVHHLTGPNGCGKSTLIGAVATAVPRASGELVWDGLDPEVHTAARARLGYLAAQPSLPGFLTVREAWKMAAALRRRPGWDGVALEQVLSLPPEVRLSQCSSGMRQKAELLAALAGDPDLLLLDEPLANLDTASASWVRTRMTTHRGIVIVAHHGEISGARAVPLATAG